MTSPRHPAVVHTALMLALGLGMQAWVWASARTGCLGSALFVLPYWVSATLAAGETARFKRYAFINQYLASTGRLARLLRGGWLLVVWQGAKALFLTLLLMVSSLSLETGSRLVLLADLVLLPALLYVAGALLRGEIRAELRAPLIRHWAHWVNTLLLWFGLTVAILFSGQADYTDRPWQDVVRFGAAQPHVGCDALDVLARFQTVGEALALWAAQNLFLGLEQPQQVLFAWVVFSAAFGVSFLMAWAYSRVLVGAWAQPWRVPMLNLGSNHEPG
jgi:hypothetical protein